MQSLWGRLEQASQAYPPAQDRRQARSQQRLDNMDEFDEAIREELEVDASAPSPLSMLEVLEEAAERSHASRKAACDMQAAVAIKAILDGADPRGVMQRCGFKPHLAPEPDQNSMFGMLGMTPQTPPVEIQFMQWLGNTFMGILQEKFEQGGG